MNRFFTFSSFFLLFPTACVFSAKCDRSELERLIETKLSLKINSTINKKNFLIIYNTAHKKPRKSAVFHMIKYRFKQYNHQDLSLVYCP